MITIRGGTVVTSGGAGRAEVVIGDDGRIVDVAADTTDAPGPVIDAGGLLVMPGMIDAHVHFDEPGRVEWEGFDTGSAAAAAGGVTTVVDMPIDCDPPTTTAAAVRAKALAADASSRVDVAMWGGLTPGSVSELEEMAAAGVAGFKAFACPSGWDDFPPADDETLSRGARIAGQLGLPVAVHCETTELGHTVGSEVAAIRRAARIVTGGGARLHVVHVSSAAGIDEARRWRGVSTETCPHYLALDPRLGPAAHCMPPIRDEAERELLWRRVIAGDVDAIASDHSPCPAALKASVPPWPGVDGVGMSIPVLLTSGRLSLERIAELTTSAARILRLPAKGAIAAGFDADLALVDPDECWSPDQTSLWSRNRCSPYAGGRFTARVVMTLVRGRVIFTKASGPTEAGRGRVVRPAR